MRDVMIASLLFFFLLVLTVVSAANSKTSTFENENGKIDAPEEVNDYNPNVEFKVTSKLGSDEQFKIKIISEGAMDGISMKYLDFEDVSIPVYNNQPICTPIAEENKTEKDRLTPNTPRLQCITKSSLVSTVAGKREVWHDLPLEVTTKTKENNNDLTTYEFKSKKINIFSKFRLAFLSTVGSLYKYSINAFNSATKSILLDPWVNTTIYADYFNSTNWNQDSGYNFSFPGVNIVATNCTLPNSTIGITNTETFMNGSNGSIYAAFTIGASLQDTAENGCVATTVCSAVGGYEISKAIDGSNTSRYATSSCSTTEPWIILTCAKNITVAQITIMGPPHMGGRVDQGYFLSFLDSTSTRWVNLTWAFNITAGETGDAVRYNYFLPEPITSTGFRLKAALSLAIDYGRLNEFWLYNASFYNSSVISDKIIADRAISSVILDAVDDNKGNYGGGINYSVSNDGLSWTSIDRGVDTSFAGGTDIYWKADFIIGSDTRLTPIIYQITLTPSFLFNGMGYSNSSINDTFVNYLDRVVARTYWISNSSLAGFIFNSNASGLWRNETYNTTFNPSNFSYSTMIINVTHDRTIGWRFYTNDSAGTNIETSIYTFNVQAPTDTTPPYSWGNKTSSTWWNEPVTFQANWTDTDKTLAGFIFNTNASGTWANSSFNTSFSPENISYATAFISVPNGTDVGWRFYANDSSGNMNQTEIFRFNANSSIYGATFVSPTNIAPLLVTPGLDKDTSLIFAFTRELTNLTSNINWTNITIGNNQAIIYNMRNISPRECNNQGYGLYQAVGCHGATGCHEDDSDGTIDGCEDQTYCGDNHEASGDYEHVTNIYLNATTVEYNETIQVKCEFQPDNHTGTYYLYDVYMIAYNNGTGWRNIDYGTTGTFTTGAQVNKTVVFAVDNITGVHSVRCGIGYIEAATDAVCYHSGYADNDDFSFNVTKQRFTYSTNNGWNLNFTLPKQNISGRQDIKLGIQRWAQYIDVTDDAALDYGSVRWVLNSNTTNSTLPRFGDMVVFGLNWTTNNTPLSGFVLSTNASGVWANSSFNTTFNQYNTSYSNATINLTRNKDVGWRFYTNNSFGYMNTSEIFYFTISNSIPVINIVSITPAPAATTNNLTCAYTSTEYDGDPIWNYSFTWYRNGTSMGHNSSHLNSTNLTATEDWTCSVIINDGTNISIATNSSVITIGDNTPPTISNLTAPASGYTDVVFVINASCGDTESAISAGYPIVEIYDPNLAYTNHSMTLTAGNNYYKSYTFSVVGSYNISFYCQDTSNNMAENKSTGLTFISSTRPASVSPGGGGGSSTMQTIIQTVETVLVCGNDICELGENPENCPSDCKINLDTLFCFGGSRCADWQQTLVPRIAIYFLLAVVVYIMVVKTYKNRKKKQ